MSTCPKCRSAIKSSGKDAEYFMCGTTSELWSDTIDQSESCKQMVMYSSISTGEHTMSNKFTSIARQLTRLGKCPSNVIPHKDGFYLYGGADMLMTTSHAQSFLEGVGGNIIAKHGYTIEYAPQLIGAEDKPSKQKWLLRKGKYTYTRHNSYADAIISGLSSI